MLRTTLIMTALLFVVRSLAAAETPAGPTDKRLDQNVTLALKATALADVCDRLRADTQVALAAGPSVADEKVTVFCKELPLREVMRQISRPFGYTWLRKGKEGAYRYELEQDLRSRREEDTLRSRARAAAVAALDREMERYRPYLKLSVEEAMARAESAPPEEKRLLQRVADPERGAIQLYFQLSSRQRAALLAGQVLRFDTTGSGGRLALPAEATRGTWEGLWRYRATQDKEQYRIRTGAGSENGRPLASLPEGRLMTALRVDAGEVGQLRLSSSTGFFLGTPRDMMIQWQEALSAFNTYLTNTSIGSQGANAGLVRSSNLVVGQNTGSEEPSNAAVNARHAGEPGMQRAVTLPRVRSVAEARPGARERVTSAEVLEALHRATGLPIVADFYTRFYAAGDAVVPAGKLFDTLNLLADRMKLRWDKEGEWLTFRSLTYYDDRLQEVPNRLLARWQSSRNEHEMLTLDDLTEIAQLTDAQLDAHGMALGAELLWGLAEWYLGSERALRAHMRYLATLSPTQRRQLQGSAGLPFAQLSRTQQQQFVQLTLGSQAGVLQPSAADLAAGTLRLEYSVPGWFRWRGAVPVNPNAPNALPLPAPTVCERTAEATLAAARRIDLQVTAAQIRPTALDLRLTYTLGATKDRRIQREVDRNGTFIHVPE